MSSSVRHILAKRPILSTTLATGASLAAAATGVELYADYYRHDKLPRAYDDGTALHAYWMHRPATTCLRIARVVYELTPLAVLFAKDFYIVPTADAKKRQVLYHTHATRLRLALTKLGPAFVKMGQQLSIRPDVLPPVVLQELQKLCDSVEPIPDAVAFGLLETELRVRDLNDVFERLEMVAAASLGQVYKATLKRDDPKQPATLCAVKIQRPHMRRDFSLDLFVLLRIGKIIDAFTTTFTHQPPFHEALYASFAKASYAELDYEQEAANQVKFRKELASRHCPVVVPKVFHEYTTERVLTSEWIEGIKLADSDNETIRRLIPVGVELFLTQLLDIGSFHSDPHPGNMLVTQDGKLCLIDFGLCTDVDLQTRNALTKAIVHLLIKDFDSLVLEDAKELGFLPRDYDANEIKPIIAKILTVGIVEGGSNMHNRKRKLMEITSELNEVFFRYPFSVPPFFALVTKGLGLLEGIALTGDPDFDIFRASAPFARRRAISVLGSRFSRRAPQPQ